MICGTHCQCMLCRELGGINRNVQTDKVLSDNFILAANKKFTYFGMEMETNFSADKMFSAITNFGVDKSLGRDKHFCADTNVADKRFRVDTNVNTDANLSAEPNLSADLIEKRRHKSVIYISDNDGSKSGNSESEILNSEVLDEFMSLNSSDTTNIITVVFKETFSYAQHIINDVNTSPAPGDSGDDFPLGIEADAFNKKYLKRQRLSSNSRTEQVYPPIDSTPDKDNKSLRVNTPANIPTSESERMVSPKRKVEHFPNLYVANNVKTSTFNEQNDGVRNKHGCSHRNSHTPINLVPERDTGPGSLKLQAPVASRTHHHLSVQELRMQHQRVHQCNSSSDENRSSGHASMSDTGNSSPRGVGSGMDRFAAGMAQKSTRSRNNTQHSRSRHRATPARLQVPWTGGGGLEDIKQALQQLTMRSHTSTSTYSSVSAGSESSEPAIRRLIRHSSLETINTNITSADEFVWVDSHNRLVELQHLPWTNHCILRVLQTGRCRDHMSRVSVETIPRLSYLLQRALVRLGRETQRIILCPPVADSCIKACQRAAAMLAMSADGAMRQSKSSRAGLQLHVGRFHRWMTDVKLSRFVHDYASVYLCAGLENLLEEILLQCVPNDSDVTLTASLLEHAIANNGDLWGLLQPYAHLNAGRIASGALALPHWASVSSINSSKDSGRGSGIPEPSLMTTCVGSLSELQDLIGRMQPRIPLCPQAMRALFYFMRCSQLEHGEQGGSAVQELCYERAYVVLPPLVEWVRVATVHGEHRSASILDRDDIMQAARLLLPGVDCPVRPLGEEAIRVRRITGGDDDHIEATRYIQVELAFRLMLTGRPELIQQAMLLLPPNTCLDTFNLQGYTALMLAALNNDEFTLSALMDAGACLDVETPAAGNSQFAAVNGETQHWTALTYAAARGHTRCARILLERGASVEGGAQNSEDKCTITPLQAACGSGNMDMIQLLLSHGANPFLSTQIIDTLCYSASSQRGCYSPISVAAAHGQQHFFQKLIAQPITPITKEVLSLEEMLAEGAPSKDHRSSPPNKTPQFTKMQIKCLQEAMYHSTENNHLDISVEIRSLGVPWTLHCWMHSLSAAHEARLDCVIDQLLQDFLQVCPDEYSSQFVQECLPLLFNIFRYSKKEGTTLLLADIFSTCFGWELIKPIRDCVLTSASGSRIDPKYVNNPELSDVTFRVEGRIFYAHKIVLVTASPRLRAMLSSKLCEGGTPTVQINDIRYHIFQIVMQFLYQGGCKDLEPAPEDILELMAAANFFQLDGLLRYCEGRCSAVLALDNVVSMYIHAKVYNAVQLLEYCQGFLLQNMVALLTYDDSVKRLLFAKKLPNHDVLAGLLLTLQNRIKMRQSQQGACKIAQKNSK